MLRFASFELDVRSRELRRGTHVVRLQDQPFEILQAMLERPGEVVTREELARRLWPNGTFVDFEHSLNAAVKRLRAALGDDADRPRFVETLPRRGYRFIAAMIPAPGRRETTGEIVRLAVLPFTNLSADSGQDYFSDGLTDEMIAQLGRLGRGRLAVLAYSSSMVFKRTTRRAREIGETLQVDYVLEGSVRRDGDRVRIIARLVETASETPLWSETFDMRLADCLLSAQVDVAAQIARALQMELVPGDDDQPGGSHDAAAYQAYLKGRYHWNQLSVNRATGLLDEEGLAQTVARFEEALQLDPGFAGAAAALARARLARVDYGGTCDRAAFDAAEESARRAIEIAPQLADAYIAMGDIRRMRDFDWRGAEAEYAHAIALNPSSEVAHRVYGLLLAALGRRREALHEAKRAHALDPLCLVASTSTAWVHYLAHDYRTAAEQCAITLKLEPAFLPARRLMAASLQGLDRPCEALTELESALAQVPDDPVTLAWLAHARAFAGDAAGATRAAARVRAHAGPRPLSLYHLAIAELGDGNPEAAMAALERAVEDRDPAVVNIATEPRFAPLHGNHCFTRLVDRLGLTTVA